eukprot:TRINITY_DN6088_c0_g1_i2.p1 TRINITY_DN6088_c0_g1~~TRINITY_DN6088_c0_g1_i2.p1  ORF type:complete len:204 (+),score=-20.99 TRINITY_DN6088_c0_g1_i2:262-873(+)
MQNTRNQRIHSNLTRSKFSHSHSNKQPFSTQQKREMHQIYNQQFQIIWLHDFKSFGCMIYIYCPPKNFDRQGFVFFKLLFNSIQGYSLQSHKTKWQQLRLISNNYFFKQLPHFMWDHLVLPFGLYVSPQTVINQTQAKKIFLLHNKICGYKKLQYLPSGQCPYYNLTYVYQNIFRIYISKISISNSYIYIYICFKSCLVKTLA